MIVLHPSYFSPIVQYAAILQEENYEFEVCDNFQKQTYRNRCYIYSPNGKQLLNVPVKNNKAVLKEKTIDIRIDYDTEDWQKNHFKSFETAYRSSPFFEFYEDEIIDIFSKKQTFLMDLNLDIHAFIMNALQEKSIYTKTENFELNFNNKKDFRELIQVKNNFSNTFEPYHQVFDNKHHFISNLSILDLLFMEGPCANIYLSKLKL